MSKVKKEASPLPSLGDIENNFMEEEGTNSTNPPENDEEENTAEEDEFIPETEEKGPHRTRPMKHLEEMEGTSVRVHREDGVYKKRLPVEMQGLSSQMMPPITKRKIAVYEVLGKDQIDPLTKEPVKAPVLVLPGKFVIYDPFQNNVLQRHRLLKNVTRSEKVNRGGVEVVEEVVEDLEFFDGFKNVAIDRNYMEYVLLELHPLNESNRWRNKQQAAAFRRIDIGNRKDWTETVAGMDLSFQAEKTIVDMTKAEDIITYATAVGIPTAGRSLITGNSSVKSDLRLFARQHPKEFFQLNKNESMAIKMAVLEADDLGLIEYTVDKKQWLFSTDGDLLYQVVAGEDPLEGAIKALKKSQWRGKYEKLQEQLNYWE